MKNQRIPAGLNKPIRQNYDFPLVVFNMLTEIKEATHLTSIKDAVIACITTGYWVMKKVQEGKRITAMDPVSKDYVELYIPAFELTRNKSVMGESVKA